MPNNSFLQTQNKGDVAHEVAEIFDDIQTSPSVVGTSNNKFRRNI